MKDILAPHQKEAVRKMKNGCILCGGVGTGKSRTALAYYEANEGDKKLYVITTAKKRDTLDWNKESLPFLLYDDIVVDSWNNIEHYSSVKNAFFIFDEQRVIGSGTWAKSFIKIAKVNRWILLTATPGDTWMDYIPVFVANGYYKNRSEFIMRHVVFKRFSKFPSIERFIDTDRLEDIRDSIVVMMHYNRSTVAHENDIYTSYDKSLYSTVVKNRWDPYANQPIKDISGICRLARKVVNSDDSKLQVLVSLYMKHKKIIVFYNYDYELALILEKCIAAKIPVHQLNGHKHDDLPSSSRWVYLVQYAAGSESWNCTTANTIVFYSQSYSYKSMIQARGRINRMNTNYVDLYYYTLKTESSIDKAVDKALKNKENFNERLFEFA